MFWTSNCRNTTEAMEVNRSECGTCFSISGIRPLSLNNFEIIKEWSKSVTEGRKDGWKDGRNHGQM